MTVYDDLGISPIINADARWTMLGGSLMSREVLAAMNAAAGHYVNIHELQRAAGSRIAHLTRNEAAYVSANATAGIVISVLACITRGDQHRIARLPDVSDVPHEVIVHSGHRIPFDPAISVGCGRLIQVGNAYHTAEIELEAAFTPRTAAVFYVAGSHVQGALSLETTVRIAHEHDVPVIVDAAAQLPPRTNLWHLSTEVGADLVIFSGGKDLCGPQASGLIVGTEPLIAACRAVGPPSPYWPRALKTGKEEIAGLVRAVELYMQRDEDAYLQQLEQTVATWVERFNTLPGVTSTRLTPNVDGQPTPRASLTIDSAITGVTAAELAAQLMESEPQIKVGELAADAIYLNAETLEPGEETIVMNRITSVLAARNAATPVGG